MIIDNLNVIGMSVAPNEAYAPLRIDANAVLPFAFALQGFEPVAWGHPQAVEKGRSIKHQKLAERSPLDVRTEFPRPLTIEQSLGIAAAKRLDHTIT
jgi:hypothetical protein